MYSTVNGVKIYYDVFGAGFPFVMIHANPFDHNLWMYQIARFSTYFKIIAVDIRGYGRSDKPETPFSLKDMADDVLGVCRDEGIKEAIVGGVSVGSGMALLMGLDHPELCKALILVGGSSGPGARLTIAFTATLKSAWKNITSNTSKNWSHRAFLKQNLENTCLTLSSNATPGFPASPSARFSAPAAART